MKIDASELQRLVDKARSEKQRVDERSSGGERLPLQYLGEDGRFAVRILYNVPSSSVQRKITRHTVGDKKYPCLKAYGEDCPICNAISEAEQLRGRDCGVYRKYGAKTRGFFIGRVVKPIEGYSDLVPDSTVIIMYPKTVYDIINNRIVEAGDHLTELISSNENIPIVLSKEYGGKPGTMKYDAYIDAFNKSKVFEDANGKTGDELFDEYLESLPSLASMYMPENPSDEIRQNAREAAEVIRAEYAGNDILNPRDTVSREQVQNAMANANTTPTPTSAANIPQSVSMNSPAQSQGSPGGTPACFGEYAPNTPKCSICESEIECFQKSNP